MTASGNSCVVVVLTFNSATIIGETLAQALKVSSNVFVVDSGSKDGCDDIARRMGCEVVQRPFTNYSDQRNWAISQVAARYQWHAPPRCGRSIGPMSPSHPSALYCRVPRGRDAYMLRRRDYFMGRQLRFSRRESMAPAAVQVRGGSCGESPLRPTFRGGPGRRRS